MDLKPDEIIFLFSLTQFVKLTLGYCEQTVDLMQLSKVRLENILIGLQEMKDIITFLTPILIVVLGFIFNRRLANLKSGIDFESNLKAEQYKAEVDYYKNKLLDFLNPLIACIEFDNSIWRKLSMLSDSNDTFSENLSVEVEKNHLLLNLTHARDLVRKNLHYITLDGDLYKSLIEFTLHVAVYESIRNSNEKCNPIDVGAPFPPKLEALVKHEYLDTLAKYEGLVKTANKNTNYTPSVPEASKIHRH